MVHRRCRQGLAPSKPTAILNPAAVRFITRTTRTTKSDRSSGILIGLPSPA
ncbi:hypothetical protein PtA15_5A844, partial [Puccinia triticina]